MTPAVEALAPARVATTIWIGFDMMCVGMFMAILDIQVVATSLPTIEQALDIAQDQMSWVQTAYLIAEIIAIPLTGLLIRLLTMRGLFVVAVTSFTLASIGCAGSGSFATLIAFRILQGFSGGTRIPAVFSAVFLLFPFRLQGGDRRRSRRLGTHARPVVGGGDHLHLFLAVALSDQRCARLCRRFRGRDGVAQGASGLRSSAPSRRDVASPRRPSSPLRRWRRSSSCRWRAPVANPAWRHCTPERARALLV